MSNFGNSCKETQILQAFIFEVYLFANIKDSIKFQGFFLQRSRIQVQGALESMRICKVARTHIFLMDRTGPISKIVLHRTENASRKCFMRMREIYHY